MSSGILLSVILVSYNTREMLRECLKSLLVHFKTSPPEIIVVDNCSQDGSVDMVDHDFPEVRLIRNESNGGFARGTNQGIHASHGKYVLLLNPDTLIVGNAIDEMLRWMKTHPETGICGPQLLNEDGTIQRSLFSFPSLLTVAMVHLCPFLAPINRLLGIGEFKDHKRSQLVDCISGACCMIRRDVIKSVGLLDERFFLNGEEMDLCLRTKWGGWKVYYLAEAKVIHYQGKSSEPNPALGFIEFHRAQHLYYAKHFGRLKRIVLKIILFLGVLLRVAYYALKVFLLYGEMKERAKEKCMLFRRSLRWYLSPGG